jgi:hypothetical protein
LRKTEVFKLAALSGVSAGVAGRVWGEGDYV